MGGFQGHGERRKNARSAEHALIRDLAELLNETGLTEIEIERDGLKSAWRTSSP